MTIESISISVFELAANTTRFNLRETTHLGRPHWVRTSIANGLEAVHVLHVRTSDGIEGMCTVGDARYTTMRGEDLEQLRIMTVGENPLDREYLDAKLRTATRSIFTRPGWAGAFDNCLWDIAGKAAGLPVHALIGRARNRCPAYYNYGGKTIAEAIEDGRSAVSNGFTAIKDHFNETARENIAWCQAVREAVGDEIDLLHDAAWCQYTFDEAVRVGRALHDLNFHWFEEPLEDRDMTSLIKLGELLEIPIVTPETLMHDRDLSAQWLIRGATDLLRGNARLGTTSLLKLAHLAELHNTNIELNGPGGLFGLVHAHLVCAIRNTSYYEYFPGGTRDEIGKEIGLVNPPVPQDGYIAPPDASGWGAEWDMDYFMKKRTGEM